MTSIKPDTWLTRGMVLACGLLLGGALTAGCSSPSASTKLPDITALPPRGDSASQQARAASAMKELSDQKSQHEAEALRQIEKSR